jgi:hypothetical protein
MAVEKVVPGRSRVEQNAVTEMSQLLAVMTTTEGQRGGGLGVSGTSFALRGICGHRHQTGEVTVI